MNSEQIKEAIFMKAKGYSAMSIARCLTGVHYKEIEEHFGDTWPKHPPYGGMSPAFYKWLMEDCIYTWRPNNQNAPDAPWSRIAE